MATTETVTYKFKADTDGFVGNINSAQKSTDGFVGKFKKVGGVLATGSAIAVGTGAAVVGVSYKFATMASDLNESLNVVNEVFGESAKDVEKWSKDSIKSMGLSQTEALKTAGTFGALGKSLNVPGFETLATDLTGLSADLASFYNISQDQSANALKGIFTGETESLKSLGIILNDNTLNNSEFAKSIGKTTSQMTEAEKVQARYSVVMEATSSAQGDFERTSDGFANKQRIIGEQFKQLGTEIGQKLLPVIETLAGWFSGVLDVAIDVLSGETDGLGTSFDTLGSIFETVMGIAEQLWEALQPLFKAIGDLVGAIFELGSNVLGDIFSNDSLISSVIDTFGAIYDTIYGIVTDVVVFITGVVNFLSDLWDKYGDEIMLIWEIIVDTVKVVVETIQTVWETLVGILVAFWDQFGDEILAVINFVAPIVIAIFIAVYGVIYGLVVLLKYIFIALGVVLVAVFKVAFLAIQAIINIFIGIWKLLVFTLKVAWNILVGFVVNVFKGAFAIIKVVINVFLTFWKMVINAIKVVWQAFVNIIVSVFKFAFNIIKGVFNFFKGIFLGIVGIITGSWDTFVNGLVTAVEGVVDFVLAPFQLISDGIEAIIDFIAGLWEGLVGGISDGIDTVAGFFGVGDGKGLFSTQSYSSNALNGSVPQGGSAVYSSQDRVGRANRTVNNNFTITPQNTMTYREAVRQKNFHIRTKKLEG